MNEFWYEVWRTVLHEFSDLPSVEQMTRVAVRLLMAAALGGVLGWEREQRGKAAGVRTHMLVSLGAALFVLVPQQAGVSPSDLTRVLQGLVAGIGFLGAGTIYLGQDRHRVKGLTTAAGIWMTCAIGAAVGLGREATAVVSTILALVIFSLGPLFTFFVSKTKGKGPPEKHVDPNVLS